MSNYPGIDYGSGKSNVDTKTGIHFGVISMHSLTAFDWDCDTETVYVPRCPACGGELAESCETPLPCPHCEHDIRDGEQYGDEPDATVLKGRYEGHLDSHGDMWLTQAPYYTHAQFCSPCAPGAGHLDNPCEDGPRTYCFGADMYMASAPYPVYSVATGELIPK